MTGQVFTSQLVSYPQLGATIATLTSTFNAH